MQDDSRHKDVPAVLCQWRHASIHFDGDIEFERLQFVPGEPEQNKTSGCAGTIGEEKEPANVRRILKQVPASNDDDRCKCGGDEWSLDESYMVREALP